MTAHIQIQRWRCFCSPTSLTYAILWQDIFKSLFPCVLSNYLKKPSPPPLLLTIGTSGRGIPLPLKTLIRFRHFLHSVNSLLASEVCTFRTQGLRFVFSLCGYTILWYHQLRTTALQHSSPLEARNKHASHQVPGE